jgi:NADH-quinone oxidoreductase subunit F
MDTSRLDSLRELARKDFANLASAKVPVVYLGAGSCGKAAGADAVKKAVLATLEERKLRAQVLEVGCVGPCYLEPLMDIAAFGNPRISYANVTAEHAPQILESYLVRRDPMPSRAVGHFGDAEFAGIPRFFDLPMLKAQKRIVLRNCGFIDPERLDHYLATDGYEGLKKALGMSPDALIEEITKSQIRGRGGAGFPTGKKWRFCRDAKGDSKYMICNADEGDPGAFMNRSLIEGDPHAVLEGLLIAAYAIGASSGYVYIRAEYPLAIQRLRKAIAQMYEVGLLGNDILGSGFSFDLHIKEGAGAFVCGEETALIHSIEGKRGMPRMRPPFPATSGLHGKPTVINNVETLGTVAQIVRHGADWYRQFGVPGNYGTKTFSIVGKAKRTGMIEVPLGIKLRDLIFEIGGGAIKPFKGVQTGGPSGGCLSERFLDTPVEYESLAAVGSIMGSGGLIVMDEDTCMVDIARYFMGFCAAESCGNCTSCREGLACLHDLLEDISEGRGTHETIILIERLADAVESTSLCALGTGGVNPVLSTLRYFRDEYSAHVNEKRCPAGVCKALITFDIDAERCNGCTLCAVRCPQGAVVGEKKQPHTITQELCIKCGICKDVCNRDAVLVQ